MGQVLDVGSVVGFYPASGRISLSIEQKPGNRGVAIVGWATVVVLRDQWVISTALDPVGNCPECGAGDPLMMHLGKVHKLEAFWGFYG